jgi:hypothetical protein
MGVTKWVKKEARASLDLQYLGLRLWGYLFYEVRIGEPVVFCETQEHSISLWLIAQHEKHAENRKLSAKVSFRRCRLCIYMGGKWRIYVLIRGCRLLVKIRRKSTNSKGENWITKRNTYYVRDGARGRATTYEGHASPARDAQWPNSSTFRVSHLWWHDK